MQRTGRKVGINVPEVQRKLGISHPLIGWLNAYDYVIIVPTERPSHR